MEKNLKKNIYECVWVYERVHVHVSVRTCASV